MSKFDKKRFSPELRALHRQKQREYCKNKKSIKWRRLDKKIKLLKKTAIRNHYKNFTTCLKKTSPRKSYRTVKQIGGLGGSAENELKIEKLEGLSEPEVAEVIVNYFSAISRQYSKVYVYILPTFAW